MKLFRADAKLFVIAALLVVSLGTLIKFSSFPRLPYERFEHQAWTGTPQAPVRRTHPAIPEGTKHKLLKAYGDLPLSFEANQGQIDPRVKILSRGNGYTLFLTPTEAVLALGQVRNAEFGMRNGESPVPLGVSKTRHSALRGPHSTVVRMQLDGANPHLKIAGLEELSGKSNYLVGNDPKKWRTNVPSFAKVRYENVWRDVDLIYYGNQRQLEFDLVVAPSADPRVIQLAFEGAQDLRLDAEGDLILISAGGDLRLQKPRIYQKNNNTKREIAGSYILDAKSVIRNLTFEIPGGGISRGCLRC